MASKKVNAHIQLFQYALISTSSSYYFSDPHSGSSDSLTLSVHKSNYVAIRDGVDQLDCSLVITSSSITVQSFVSVLPANIVPEVYPALSPGTFTIVQLSQAVI